MNRILKSFLFGRGILVGKKAQPQEVFNTVFTLSKLFAVKITSGHELACDELIRFVSEELGENVPEAFYRGFPRTVRSLSSDALLFDQLVHYAITYGFNITDKPGHSIFEGDFERIALKEGGQLKEFSIVNEERARELLVETADIMLRGTRPIANYQYDMLLTLVLEENYVVTECANKDTAIRLLLDTRNTAYARFIKLPDVIRLVEILVRNDYGRWDSIKKLNLKNRDRVFITKVIDSLFPSDYYRDCFERRRDWCGLLHHIHYKPKCECAENFVNAMRRGSNLSWYSLVEEMMAKNRPVSAAHYLYQAKGGGAVLRNLNYFVSRCTDEEDIDRLLCYIDTDNLIILIQLYLSYCRESIDEARCFMFTRFNKLCVHRETDEEVARRRSTLSDAMRVKLCDAIRERIMMVCEGRLPKVYIDGGMKKTAVPLKAATAMGGYGTLPAGSRQEMSEGRTLRPFVYWEKVNDIDLSLFLLDSEFNQTEFSWRTMYASQSELLCFSGDQTSGYNGGSEFYDVDTRRLAEEYPDSRYLVACANVYSGTPFSGCVCRAGCMLREDAEEGEVFEPKTVKGALAVNCESTFAYLFAVDLVRHELIWLNLSVESTSRIAGNSSMKNLIDCMQVTDHLSLYDLVALMATEVVDSPDEADLIFSDRSEDEREGIRRIRSCDIEDIIGFMNKN